MPVYTALLDELQKSDPSAAAEWLSNQYPKAEEGEEQSTPQEENLRETFLKAVQDQTLNPSKLLLLIRFNTHIQEVIVNSLTKGNPAAINEFLKTATEKDIASIYNIRELKRSVVDFSNLSGGNAKVKKLLSKLEKNLQKAQAEREKAD
jgi:hypothetical protein